MFFKRFGAIRTGLLLLLLANAGCTTLRSPKQRLKVTSQPPGAKIFWEGEAVGLTPAFVEVRRSHRAQLELEKEGYEELKMPLSTKYRWRDSLISNLIWFNFAPVGWAADLISQTSWDFETPETPKLRTLYAMESRPVPVVAPDQLLGRVAIAPPQHDHELLSDELGEKLEAWAHRRYPKAEILDYSQTLVTFADFAYQHDNLVHPRFSDELAFRLNATHILHSRATEVENQKILVDGELRDVFSDGVNDRVSEEFPSEKLSYQKNGAMARTVLKFATFLPNTITFDTSSPYAVISAGAQVGNPPQPNYTATSNKPPTVWSTISGVGVRSLRGPELYQPLAFDFRFVPTASAYYDQFRVDSRTGTNEFADQTFKWYAFQLGYGPEVDLLSPIGIFYFQIIPALGLDWISYQAGGYDKSLTKSNVHVESEVGFSFFLSRNFNLRLYGRTLIGAQEAWTQVLSEAAGHSIQVLTAGQVMTGLSLGYYFPEARAGIKKWFRK